MRYSPMPWKETKKMNQKIEFAIKSMKCENFRELCREYGISAKTGYKWQKRFMAHGVEGLEDQSRKPDRHSEQLGDEVVCEIVRLKNAHPHWGPRKIRELYRRKHTSSQLASESSFKRVLEKAGLVKKRKRVRRGSGGRVASGLHAEAPNDVWTVDFKGWWKSPQGLKVEPLTVRDEHSRMILEMRAVKNSRTETIRGHFERLFRLYGLPGAIRSDNGPPFASPNGLLGLSHLSAWWLALGIDLERGRPGCPQDNGGHERMHLDIRDELQAGRIGADQEAFELWREEFNTVRPHESLGMATPAEVYHPSKRKYTGTPDDLDYGAMLSRRVQVTGTIRYQGEFIAISTVLRGWSVGLAPKQEDALLEVWFGNYLIGHIDPETSAFVPPLPPGDQTASGASAGSATLRRPKPRAHALRSCQKLPKV